ncbi:hypothetical protein M011DRAFT_276018 [Sporormia fimetaria CBS 119925]|uniref:CHAT domain-containing protein n=1 Tax=Sporormia fimetaria CBS 119925 TaxID=1340428 RepID=A0A6A6VJN2_9PLEO|nr:hypothetical protein M011DRAFT_276018 [Sporormia fimetaria CBS 119925]
MTKRVRPGFMAFSPPLRSSVQLPPGQVESGTSNSAQQWPATPPLDARQYNELWDDIRNDIGFQAGSNQDEDISQIPRSTHVLAELHRVHTHDRDPEFSRTSVEDLYTSIRENAQVTASDIETLDRYLPRKIVNDTRDNARNYIRLGDTEAAYQAVQDGLTKLKEKGSQGAHVISTPWRISTAELLIDIGHKEEAREILSACPNVPRATEPEYVTSLPSPGAGADDDFEKMRKMAEVEDVESELDRYRRAEAWDQAVESGEKLFKIDPSYFDLNEPMERFKNVRRIAYLGLLKEIQASRATNTADRNRALREALEIYNHGCFASELFHEFFDGNDAKVYGFDHSDCANIFFSAARVCWRFDKDGLIDKHGHHVLPTEFRCKGPDLTSPDWRHQALHFLEQGRARALLDSIIRGSSVDDIPRRLITRTVNDLSVLADVAMQSIKKRTSLMAASPISKPGSTYGTASIRTNGAQSVGWTPGSISGVVTERMESPPQIGRTLSQNDGDRATSSPSPLRTSDMDRLDVGYLAQSPAQAHPPVPKTEEEKLIISMKAHVRWRKALLYALTGFNSTLDATLEASVPRGVKPGVIEDLRRSIPPDTLVVEYALASTAPCGIMTIVVAHDGVKAVEWEEANTIDIQRRIGELRDSMSNPDSRSRGRAPTSALRREASWRPTSKRPALERRSSAVQQKELDDILRSLVVAPVKRHLEGKQKLIVVPSGDLAHVPWTMFFDVPITVVPSLDIWRRLQALASTPVPQEPKLSIVSNAPGDREKAENDMPSFRDIPFSRIEALYIAKLHEKTPFLADDHDRRAFEEFAKGTQVLHICAHSTFDAKNPMSSSLQLFKDPLTMTDWHKLSIKADLVVFSSCLSGISKAYDSGSTIGFAHTLLGTGTKAFVGSLWPVDDAATLLLMIMFYEELRKPLPAADALYEAQKRMRSMTETDLHDLIDELEDVAQDQGVDQYVRDYEYWVDRLREFDAKELRQERYWAAFVLTGYGSKIIYPAPNGNGGVL